MFLDFFSNHLKAFCRLLLFFRSLTLTEAIRNMLNHYWVIIFLVLSDCLSEGGGGGVLDITLRFRFLPCGVPMSNSYPGIDPLSKKLDVIGFIH